MPKSTALLFAIWAIFSAMSCEYFAEAARRRYTRPQYELDNRCPGYNELFTDCGALCDLRCEQFANVAERMQCKPDYAYGEQDEGIGVRDRVDCNPGCICSTGTARNRDGICVPMDLCEGMEEFRRQWSTPIELRPDRKLIALERNLLDYADEVVLDEQPDYPVSDDEDYSPLMMEIEEQAPPPPPPQYYDAEVRHGPIDDTTIENCDDYCYDIYGPNADDVCLRDCKANNNDDGYEKSIGEARISHIPQYYYPMDYVSRRRLAEYGAGIPCSLCGIYRGNAAGYQSCIQHCYV